MACMYGFASHWSVAGKIIFWVSAGGAAWYAFDGLLRTSIYWRVMLKIWPGYMAEARRELFKLKSKPVEPYGTSIPMEMSDLQKAGLL